MTKNKLNTFEHVVVLMLENRSFDNLLGYLYEDDVPKGKKFEGLQNRSFENPVPNRVSDYKKGLTIAPHPAKDYHQPFPDPGEEYVHVNTQLYNHIDPDNIGIDQDKMQPPYNLPSPIPTTPPMSGFVNDYINTLQALEGKYKNPTYEQYKKIMACFMPDQIPVLSTLAKEFAVFDHWFCSVPSQTWCNRAFWHAATSGGYVINPGGFKENFKWIGDVWPNKNLFNLLHRNNISYASYVDSPIALTHLIHGYGFDTSKSYNDSFKKDVEKGLLPQYTFIEPKFFGQHNDQHPSSIDNSIINSIIDSKTREGTVLLGEHLIWEVYTAIKSSDRYRDNTLLIITYDEHGGCFDHVPPPAAVPPKKGMQGEKGFKFDRLGLRVPMVMVSSHIAKNTIANDVFDHTSFIKTMCKKWHLEGLTDRDKNAHSFEGVFSDQKRTAWPDIKEPVIPTGKDADYHNDPLNDLQKSMLSLTTCIANKNQKSIKKSAYMKKNIEDLSNVKNTVGQAMKHMEDIKDFMY